METIKTENTVKINIAEQEREQAFKYFKKLSVAYEPIGVALSKSALAVVLLYEELFKDRENDLLFDLVLDSVDRLKVAVLSSEDFMNKL